MPDEPARDVIIDRPNRDKASSKATKATVILLLLASVGLMLIVAIGGWNALEGAKAILIAYMAIYLIIAFYTGRWNRGVLPLAAAFAIVLLIFAAIALLLSAVGDASLVRIRLHLGAWQRPPVS